MHMGTGWWEQENKLYKQKGKRKKKEGIISLESKRVWAQNGSSATLSGDEIFE